MIKREKIKMLLAVGFAIIVLAIYGLGSYWLKEDRLIGQIDEKLYAAAVSVPFVLEDDFHDRAVDASSISPAEDRRNIENLTQLNDQLGTKFLYTVVRDDHGSYRLTSSSALKEEQEQRKEVRYYTTYPDVSITLKQSFDESNISFSQRGKTYHALYVPVFSDRWGTYRSIFIPIRALSGKTYVVGADVDISYVQALLSDNTLKTLLELLIFTLALLPIIYTYIKALKEKNREYQHVYGLYLDQSKRSITDPLTQLFNRRKIDEELKTAFDLYHKYGRNFALVMTDLDFFKSINDCCGHHVGDKVLQSIANLLKEASRSTDIVGRWGGEEFMIICPDADIYGAFQIAEKLRIAIESNVLESDCQLTASFGVAEPQPNQTLPQLLQRVDGALYAAKRAGRNQTVKASSVENETKGSVAVA